MKKKITLIFILSLISIFAFQKPVFSQSEGQRDVTIYFFWGDGCPYCEKMEPFLASLANKYPNVILKDYEVWYNPQNQEIFKRYADALNFNPEGVPVTIIGNNYWIGFREVFKTEIESSLQACLDQQCVTEVDSLKMLENNEAKESNLINTTIKLPLIGMIDLEKQSLIASTAFIGFVDGFNPCSLWVLGILLTITLHSGSRKIVGIVGLTFLLVSTIVYSLFIVGVFSLLSYISYLKWIQIGVSLIAFIFGAINVKDYFWFKEGISFTISNKQKQKLYETIRRTTPSSSSMIALIGSASGLAVGVSLIEFSCTAGFPVIWSSLMSSNNVSPTFFLLYLAIYMLIYFIDELLFFSVALFGLRAIRLEEKHGRFLKLISGVIMIFLGGAMAINPEIMNSINSSLLVFIFALLVAGIIYLVHQKILPKLGIYVGTGVKKKK